MRTEPLWVRKAAGHDVSDEPTFWRYRCPHCGGENAYNGDRKAGFRFRGSAMCEDCGKGFAAVARPELRLDPPYDPPAEKALRCPWLVKAWSEGKHPRNHGQFARTPGAGGKTELRPNADLDAVWNAEPPKPQAPAADPRRNTALDEFMAMGNEDKPKTPAAKPPAKPPAQPPALPHHRTEQSAVSAAKAVVQAARSGGDVRGVHKQALAALQSHHAEGQKAIDRMAAAKYPGDPARAKRAADKAKQAFAAKVMVVRRKLDQLAGTSATQTTSPSPPAKRGFGPAGKPVEPPPFPSRPGVGRPQTGSVKESVAELATNVARGFYPSTADHGDVGHEILGRLRRYPPEAQAAFKAKYGIRDGDSPEAIGRRFLAKHRSGWSKDPELRRRRKSFAFDPSVFAGLSVEKAFEAGRCPWLVKAYSRPPRLPGTLPGPEGEP